MVEKSEEKLWIGECFTGWQGYQRLCSLYITNCAHRVNKRVRKLDVLRVPGPNHLPQRAKVLAHLRAYFVVFVPFGVDVAELGDALLELHLLLEHALAEGAGMLKLLLLVVEQALELSPELARRRDVNHRHRAR